MTCLLFALLLCQPEPTAKAEDTPADKAALRKELLTYPRPKPCPTPDPKVLDAAIRRGLEFLIKDQTAEGAFGSANKTKDLNIYAPIPGAHHAFQAATTALGIAALIECGEQGSAAREALEKAERWLLDNLPKVKRATPDAIYNVWAHAYGIQALVRMHQRLPQDKERQKKIEDLIRTQFDYLDRYESVDGGWGYYDMKIGAKKPSTDSTPFTTAAVLVALKEADRIGVKPPEKLVKRGVASIVRQRRPDFAYLYGEYLKWMPGLGINGPGGSLGRSQACNIAVRWWGDTAVTDDVLRCWLNRLVGQNIWLDLGRKRPIPHESKFQVAGYFYYFGHYYAAFCIEELPDAERPFYQDQLAHILLPKQEDDGSWFDYPLYDYGHCYGTSFAVMTLLRCRHAAKAEPAPAPEKKQASLAVPRGHAHNDYLHARPLHQALELGYGSIEADIHLKDGQLLVGHDTWDLRPDRTLEKLYLAPLSLALKTNGGVYPHRNEPLLLLIDIKTAGEPTYTELHKLLERHADLLTEVNDGKETRRAVTVVISGNVPRKLIEGQQRRLAAIDGRLGDLKADAPTHLMPLLSAAWPFKWKGEGPMPEAERARLHEIVAQAHAKGRQVRFWGTTEREALWKELLQAKVDFIGTDHLQRVAEFLAANLTKAEADEHRLIAVSEPLLRRAAKDSPKPAHIVFVTGDCEYRSEITMPLLAAMLEKHHGCKCTVCYATDEKGEKKPKFLKGVSGLEALKTADLAVFYLRYRQLPPDQLKLIIDYVNSGKPCVGFRTTTHAFRYEGGAEAKLNDGFGRDVFGQKWISHHGHDSSTKVQVAVGDHPIVRGVAPEFFCRSWLYFVSPLAGDCVPLLIGQAVKGETPEGTQFGKANPVAWTKSHNGARIFFTTLGHPKDFETEAMRKLALNGIWWALGRDAEIPKAGLKADTVEKYVAPPTTMRLDDPLLRPRIVVDAAK